eukprot:TRINITY_DN2677_c0_g1_i1.p1 TRINITY_DN2677_c0_g1~~TRINITY_DN2677_c0_g1_i1.p1  ORF type:complete len:847 (+),score=205.53 TRINITY_DN2677_c0_g1_i1:42-2582(+)
MPPKDKDKDLEPSQQLNPKESQLFKSIVKLYENKQFKKAIKAADTILKTKPNHGETLAMKGLAKNSLVLKEEAYDLVKKGVRYNVNSHVCWHVYGLLYRSDRNYVPALKCYKNALLRDKDNQQILRDLSLLQIHLRDVEGYVETRRHLLMLRAGQKQNWLAFAVATHAAGNHQEALHILEQYEQTMEAPEKPDYELSELILYKNSIMEDKGDYQAALDHLRSNEKNIKDRLYFLEKRAEFNLHLKNYQLARECFLELLKINPDHKAYHLGLQKASHIYPADGVHYTQDQANELVQVYDPLARSLKSDLFQRYPLEALPAGALFQSRMSAYLQPKLRKGVPTLFVDLKSLYSNPDKVAIIEHLLQEFSTNLQRTSQFAPNADTESPAVYMWTLFCLAQHYDSQGDTSRALETIDRAIAHTPTVIDLYLIKGKIYKHAGDFETASDLFEEARQMDLADRYLNTKSTIQLLQANRIDQAIDTVRLFIKDGEDPVTTLNDMQACWFQIEAGKAYARLGNYGQALKKLTAVAAHFDEFQEDQYDFHAYCVRKMTFRSYIKMLRFEDNLRNHKFFRRAAHECINLWLHLLDHPPVTKEQLEAQKLAQMEPDEKKRYLTKKRKEEKRAQEEAAQATKTGAKKNTESDPEGAKLLQADFLEEASKLIQILQRHAPQDIQTHVHACQVYLRKSKYLLVLKALKKGRVLDVHNAAIHRHTVQFLRAVQGDLSAVNAKVRDLLKKEADAILSGRTIDQFNKDFLDSHSKSYPARVAAAQNQYDLTKQLPVELLVPLAGVTTLEEASQVAKYLQEFSQGVHLEDFRTLARKLFPFSREFMTPEQRAQIVLPRPTTDED